MSFSHSDPLPINVQAALESGNTLEAIKLLREATGLGLKEAKDFIDQHQQGGASPIAARATLLSLPPEVSALLQAGRKIDAIRLLREKTGLGLKEAKETIESFQDNESNVHTAGQMPASRNGVWLVAALIAAAVIVYLIFGR